MLIQDFPYLQTVVAGSLAFALGWVWYHPRMLGSAWISARSQGGVHARSKGFFSVASFMLWMVSSCFYSFLIIIMDLQNPASFICLACLLWVAFAMPPTLMGALYTGYPFNAAAIDSAYQLAGYYIFALVHIWLGKILLLAHAV